MQIYADTGSDSTQASHVLELQRKGKTNALREKTLLKKKKKDQRIRRKNNSFKKWE